MITEFKLFENQYVQDVFYNVHDLPFETKLDIMRFTKEICYDWHADILTGMARKKTDMTFDEIMSKADEDTYFVVIHRRGYEDWNTEDSWNKWKLEVGFRTMSTPDYFLFMYADEKYVETIVKEFDLKPLR